jgi:hypothetical protein
LEKVLCHHLPRRVINFLPSKSGALERTMSTHEVIPSARRLIRSLRDMGYDFAQAVADVVDNSVVAKAKRVGVTIEFDGDDSIVRIIDNGSGMKPEQLREAMRYGAERDYEIDDLGKFGLGLKTASMSQCQRLSVISRWNPNRSDICGYAWDLDHISKTNRWEILQLKRDEIDRLIGDALLDGPGTVVIWERLDRILGYKHPYGESARKRLISMCRETEAHLSMVFHRFLAGEEGRRFKLTLNGQAVAPWDPFCRSQNKTEQLEQLELLVDHEGVSGKVTVEPFLLPHRDDFDSPEAFRIASGPAGWNQQQGFYIYRSGRMIQSGGWCGLMKNDEHTKLARVALRFSPKLDEAFRVNVAKMRVQLPTSIRESIEGAIHPVRGLARKVYDRKEPVGFVPRGVQPKAVVGGHSIGAGTDHSAASESAVAAVDRGRSLERLTLPEWVDRLRAVANTSEASILDSLCERLGSRRMATSEGGDA